MKQPSDILRANVDEQRSHAFMEFRIREILLVCSSYDGYILEEDGHLDYQINREYLELNMSKPPHITHVTTTKEALDLIKSGQHFDFVLTMFNVGEPNVFRFSKMVKKIDPQMPVVLLTAFSKEVYHQLDENDTSYIDNIFCWHGNAELIIAIIKLMEDYMNSESDILEGGVQCILLAEDSIRFYSSYLPELYRIILQQNSGFLQDAYNEQQMLSRKRSRPKVLLATNYSEARAYYEKYKKNLLGVISDIGMVENPGDSIESEISDAGLQFCKYIKEQTKWMPVILQSSQLSLKQKALELGAGFIAKNSKTLLEELRNVVLSEFGFGDFIFRNPETNKEIGRAKDLYTLQQMLIHIDDSLFENYTQQMKFSKWLYARGLFPLAKVFRNIDSSHFANENEHKNTLIDLIQDYRTILGQGIIVRFDAETYSDTIAFSRMGQGSIGGKARGLAFMNSILSSHELYLKYPGVRISIPRCVVIATDYFDQFIEMNGLKYIIQSDLTDDAILAEFISCEMPSELLPQLKALVQTCKGPLAVRSSSKLEDSHYQPFAGVYSTYMIPRAQDDDQMLRMLVRAIKSVYASTYFASSKAYIQTTENVLSEEKMAVIIQEICGTEYKGYFFPTMSGVARSCNLYPIDNEKSSDGVCNLVMGLGKAVVDGMRSLRFCPRYPDKALQTSTPELAVRDAQTEVMALDLNPESFRQSTDDAVNLRPVPISEIQDCKNSKCACSLFDYTNNMIVETQGFNPTFKLITFNRILKYGAFPLSEILQDMLRIGEQEMHCPVEIEFAVNMDVAPGQQYRFDFLQIRPIVRSQNYANSTTWEQVDISDALVYSTMALGIGHMNGIEHIVYIKPGSFSSLETEQIAEELKQFNLKLKELKKEYVLIGAGRWGSSDPNLGVPVRWEHISQARVIVEEALTDYNIEFSQGTHFFQNVTSLGVGYMSVDSVNSDSKIDYAALDSMTAVMEGRYLRCVAAPESLFVCVDGVSRKGVVKKC